MTYQTYEFTAFSEADLLSNGDSNLGCGDSFTMPGAATTCISVTDNDSYLSGDNYCNENANDHYGQHASITGDNGEMGNGGQIYAEKYFWVCDTAGNWYVMIEIEQEGSNDDYFTFYTGHGYSAPEPGTELTVYSSCNVKGSWIDFNCLDAGEKVEYGSISGTVFCDTDCDGINGEVTVIEGCDYTIEAEHMQKYGFKTVSGAEASADCLVKLNCAGGWGDLTTEFSGKDGTYDVTIWVQDENDGQSTIKLKVNGQMVEAIRLDNDNDGGGSNNGSFSPFVIKDVELKDGDDITLWVDGNGHEFVRIDKIDLEGQDEEVVVSEPTKAGVTIKLIDAATGEVVATTETDANGNYSFDQVPVGDYKIMGVAPDGTEFTIQDAGSDDSIDSDVDANGMSGVVTVTADGNVDIDLGVCEKPELGSLSGRYFCDDNRDGQDNDGAGNGVAGVVVELLDAAGNGTGITTVTDANGNYSFGDLEAGTYGVKFTDAVSGKVLTTQNVGDDATDSDAADVGGGMSVINGIEVVGGQDTPDNDAGVVEELGSLSGRYFCDDNRDGQDNDGADNGVEGILVELLDENGQPTGDSVRTDANGNYVFLGLVAGTYGVKFTDDTGVVSDKLLTASDVGPDDSIDSDALGDNVMSSISSITVVAGQNTPDNDAGVYPNEAPVVTDDMGKGCADEDITVDFSDNYSDAETSASITMINGENISAGQTITLANGVDVTLTTDDEFIFNGETTYAGLDIGETATETFTVKVEDEDGAATTASIDVTFCGDANSVTSLCDSLPNGTIEYKIQASNIEFPVEDYAFNLQIVSSGDARFDGEIYAEAYCLGFGIPISQSEDLATSPIVQGSMFCSDEAEANGTFNSDQISVANGMAAADNLDLINWILNQGFESNGDYLGWEVQRAIWELTDDTDLGYLDAIDPGFGTDENVQEILAMAAANEGFTAGVGDVIGVIVDPGDAVPGDQQPFIIAINYEDYDCLC